MYSTLVSSEFLHGESECRTPGKVNFDTFRNMGVQKLRLSKESLIGTEITKNTKTFAYRSKAAPELLYTLFIRRSGTGNKIWRAGWEEDFRWGTLNRLGDGASKHYVVYVWTRTTLFADRLENPDLNKNLLFSRCAFRVMGEKRFSCTRAE